MVKKSGLTNARFAIACALSILLLPALAAGPAIAQSNCTASGPDASCRGFGSQALGNTSTAIGIEAIACVDQTAAFGLRNWAETPRAFVVGQYNARATTNPVCTPFQLAGQDPLFVVGAGLGPGNPVSEQHRNALTVLANGTTVVGLVRSPATDVGPLSTLNVVGSTYVAKDLLVGDGTLSVGRGSNTGFRNLGLWVAIGWGNQQQSCDAACGTGVCLAAYVDHAAVNRVACSATSPNRNCLCAGRR